MLKKIILLFFFSILFSCSSANKNIKVKKQEEIQSVDVLYKSGLNKYENGELQNSVDIFKKIETNYSYSDFAPRALLMISFIYYEANAYISSLNYLKKFKELYPSSKYIPYAEYLIGICLYEQINVVSKDQSETLLALKQFNKIKNNYPKTIYAEESKSKIDLINEQLAGHEMYIARYYMNKEKWAAAILRLQIVIENYQSTIFIDEALHRMVEINYRIGNIQAAKKYASILGYNFNTSEWYKKSYKIVGDKNYTVLDKEKKKSLKDRLYSIFIVDKND